MKQELSSRHTQIETHLVICKEEQIKDSDPDGERKGYVVIHGVEKRDSDYWNKKSKKQAKFEQKLPVVQLKHCYFCEVLFDSRSEFVQHCKNAWGHSWTHY